MTEINKFIEEEARVYVSDESEKNGFNNFHGCESVERAFVAGANFILHLNRWRKVEEELPKIDKVLIKVMCHFPNGNHSIRYTTGLIYSKDNCSLDDEYIEEISRSYKAIEWKPIDI